MKALELFELLKLSKKLKQELKDKVTTKTNQCEHIFDATLLFKEQGNIVKLKEEIETIDKFIKILIEAEGE